MSESVLVSALHGDGKRVIPSINQGPVNINRYSGDRRT